MTLGLTAFLFLISAAAIFMMMSLLWLLSLALKNASIVDIFWGLGFVLVAWLDYGISPFMSVSKWLMLVFVTLWGLRLGLHILIRNWGKGEDFRYAKWRKDHGYLWTWLSFIKVFLLQGFLMWVIAAPVISIRVTDGIPIPTLFDFFGAILWLVGFYFETIGDLQLAYFKSESANKDRLLTDGLWKYTRHPNYFGDALQWWGLYLIAAGAGAWWTIYSPLLMTFLLMRVSGVTLLEQTMRAKPGYEKYMQKTSAFFPWLPKRK